jgi:small subunit ribosomal protein S8
MSVTDPIADMITRMRNASRIKRREVQMPSSRLKVEIAKILKDEGFIKNYKVIEEGRRAVLAVTLKYTEGNQSVITGSRRVSKPGCRIYCTRDSVPKVLDGLGLAIISTSKGLQSGKTCEQLGVGGEVLCSVW